MTCKPEEVEIAGVCKSREDAFKIMKLAKDRGYTEKKALKKFSETSRSEWLAMAIAIVLILIVELVLFTLIDNIYIATTLTILVMLSVFFSGFLRFLKNIAKIILNE